MFRRKKKNQSKSQDEDPSDSTPEPSAPSAGGFGMFRRSKRNDNSQTAAAAAPPSRQQQGGAQFDNSDSHSNESEEPYSLQSGGHYNQSKSGRAIGSQPHDDASATSSVTFNSKMSRGAQSQASRGSKATSTAAKSQMSAEEQFMAYYSQRKSQTQEGQDAAPMSTSGMDSSVVYLTSDDEADESKAPKTEAELEEDRKQRARQAVEDRKRKAREAVEARKAKARQAALDKAKGGSGAEAEAAPSPEPTLMEKLEQENQRRKEEEEKKQQEEEERKRRESAEAQQRLLREQRLQEEEEALRREEEEMKALEEQLQREEEEARRLAEEEEELTRALLKQEEYKEQKALEDEEAKLLAEADEILRANEESKLEEARMRLEAEIIEEEEKARADEEKARLKAQEEKEARLVEEARLAAEQKELASSLAEQALRVKFEMEEKARLQLEEEQALLEAEEEARIVEEKQKAEEARLAIERFAEEEKRKAEEARLAIESFALSQGAAMQDLSVGASEPDFIDTPNADLDLDAILDGSVSALLDSALDSPMPSPSKDPSKKGGSLYGSFSKLLPGGKKRAAPIENPKTKSKSVTVSSKPQSGLRFYKSKSNKAAPASTSVKPKPQTPSNRPSLPTPPPNTKRTQTTPTPKAVTPPKKSPSPPKKSPSPPKDAHRVSDLVSSYERSPKRSPPGQHAVDDPVVDTGNKLSTRVFPKSPARSIDSTGSVCSVDRIPRSPFIPSSGDDDVPICDNLFIPHLHTHRGGCQVCIFKLSQEEKEKYDKAGRHIRVACTFGGCVDCQVFPSGEEEDPVRLCKQCFFDTHIVRPREREAFSGNGALIGVDTVQRKSPSGLKVFSKSRY
ncbi:DnaJ domain containing protein [Nitzschia inconspicua]|uniref:DnaJ domain containing protein n=1 Tax=Nitzschia inconspicua TaxID=303405 RepID=A0A9K3KYA5_9STRA|nr:DnaJ domain containing protein [Nitzschia inconspicua]